MVHTLQGIHALELAVQVRTLQEFLIKLGQAVVLVVDCRNGLVQGQRTQLTECHFEGIRDGSRGELKVVPCGRVNVRLKPLSQVGWVRTTLQSCSNVFPVHQVAEVGLQAMLLYHLRSELWQRYLAGLELSFNVLIACTLLSEHLLHDQDHKVLIHLELEDLTVLLSRKFFECLLERGSENGQRNQASRSKIAKDTCNHCRSHGGIKHYVF
mmetsp:Transcript_2774/g.6666  ORF Transcript_2774/g.6666 Transcript_2774/m.6666 type:complete len:211 (-) Transcript_2774:2156-2788(-)